MSWRGHIAAGLTRRLFGASAQVWLAPVVARALPGIGIVLATSLAATLLGLLPPWLTKSLIDKGLVAGDWNAVLLYAALGFGVGLAVLGGGVVNSLLHLRYSAAMLADLRGRMFGAALHRSAARPALPVGEALARLDGDVAEIQRFAFDTVLAAVSSVFRLAGGAAMLLLLDWRLALIPIAAAPVNLAFLAWARPRTQARAEAVRDNRGQLGASLAESLAGLPSLRVLGAEGARMAQFSGLQTRQVALLLRQRRWLELVGAVPQLTGALVRVAILAAGGALILRGDWQIGSLIAFLAYVGMMTGPLQNLLGLYHAQAQARVALNRLDALADPADAEGTGRIPGDGPGALRLVAARGAGGRHLPVDLTIRAGRHVLIDGPSGIGKSTLAGLAARLSPPAPDARVFLDGEDVSGLDPCALRRAVAVVPQAPMLFRGTLRDNLRLADPAADDGRMWTALQDAGLAETVRARGQALDLPIEEAGRNLSGGERQRIAIARALLLPFRVLVLDECLSEVDADTARAVLAAITARHPGRTLIVIAHAGPAREMRFDQTVTLAPDPALRNSRGEAPNQRAKARENAV